MRWQNCAGAAARPPSCSCCSACLIPPQVTAIPLYIGIWRLGLLDTYAAIILPSTISVFGIFLMRQFFRTVPDDLLHAARLDGLSEFAIVWRIMLPMAVPAMVSFGILSLIWNWNEFFWPLIVIQSEHLATPPLGVSFFSNAEAGTNYGVLMAAAVSSQRAADRRIPVRATLVHRRRHHERRQVKSSTRRSPP